MIVRDRLYRTLRQSLERIQDRIPFDLAGVWLPDNEVLWIFAFDDAGSDASATKELRASSLFAALREPLAIEDASTDPRYAGELGDVRSLMIVPLATDPEGGALGIGRSGVRGAFAPDQWLIVRHQGRDVGCLLLADHPEPGNRELVYMGLVPAVRGHGWGSHITQHAQWLARQAGRPRLVLAVDAANGPAIRVYESLGFRAWDRKSVYLRVFEPEG